MNVETLNLTVEKYNRFKSLYRKLLKCQMHVHTFSIQSHMHDAFDNSPTRPAPHVYVFYFRPLFSLFCFFPACTYVVPAEVTPICLLTYKGSGSLSPMAAS
jgi:hypothetical protein